MFIRLNKRWARTLLLSGIILNCVALVLLVKFYSTSEGHASISNTSQTPYLTGEQGERRQKGNTSNTHGKIHPQFLCEREIREHQLRAYHKQTYQVLIAPELLSTTQTLMVIYSRNNAESIDIRRAIRDTWANKSQLNNLDIQVIFALSRPIKRQDSSNLKEEMKTFNDLLLIDHVDSYRNLTLKTLMVLSWFSRLSNRVSGLVKCDDDVLVNVTNIMAAIEAAKLEHADFILGYQLEGIPTRQWDRKWYVPYSVYGKDLFPAFVSGTTYALTKGAASRLVCEAPHQDYVYLEDVFFTGICRAAAGVPIVHTGAIYPAGGAIFNVWKGCVSIHGFEPGMMREAWNILTDKKPSHMLF